MRCRAILSVVVLGMLLLFAGAALAQTTGGSFGGGDFSGGSTGSGGSSGSSGDSDHGDGLSVVLYLVIEIFASPWIPWPLKLVLVGGVIGVAIVVTIVRKRRRR